MLQRMFIHLSLVVLFAFTQMGIATHEISHLADLTQQNQQHKNTPNHQCEQCISHAGIENGLNSQPFVFALQQTISIAPVSLKSYFFSTTSQHYAARAPPQTA
ncbi:hypothetical protein [Methylotenera versatilis]|nr:hypothetical protein [Methylotenera versatilis]